MKIYAGTFYKEDIDKGKLKAALLKIQKEHNLDYYTYNVMFENMEPTALEVWACDIDELDNDIKEKLNGKR